jgi:hypothetical protein
MPRLLVCRECHTIDTIPLYDGPPQLEAQDPILDRVVRYHVQLHGEKLDSASLISVSEEPCNCGRVPWNHTMWEEHKDEILGNLRERWVGFHPEFYATKDTFKEDAMRCYNLHRRPQGTDCIDWLDDRKRLTPNGWAGSHVYLCHFCPVASTVTTAVRWAKGYYKKEPGETE